MVAGVATINAVAAANGVNLSQFCRHDDTSLRRIRLSLNDSAPADRCLHRLHVGSGDGVGQLSCGGGGGAWLDIAGDRTGFSLSGKGGGVDTEQIQYSSDCLVDHVVKRVGRV